MAELCYEHDLLSDAHYRDGEGDFIRDDGITLDPAVVAEVDDLVRSVLEECEDYENQDLGTKYENIGRVLEARFRQYLLETNDPPEIKDMKEEIYDWNVRFLMIDNSCFTLDELSAKYWGKFKVINTNASIITKLKLCLQLSFSPFSVCRRPRTHLFQGGLQCIDENFGGQLERKESLPKYCCRSN